MSQFEVVLPQGTVLLRNVETGETLTLSAESGPLTLGRITLDFEFAPAPASGRSRESADGAAARLAPTNADPEASVASAAVLPKPVLELPKVGCPVRQLDENPFLSPDEPLAPMPAGAAEGPSIRALQAPFDALTESDFEVTMSAILRDEENLEREIEFLRDIDGDPDDIAELEAALEALKETFAMTSKRFDAWKLAVRHAGKHEAEAREERLAAAKEAAELAKAFAAETAKKPIG